MWDIHNHLLPSLDDGASCLEETMDMLQDAYEQGMRHIIFTPHYRSGMFEAAKEDRIQIYERVRELSGKCFSDLELFLGCELHMHPDPQERIVDEIYRMPGEMILLTEFATRDGIRDIRRKLNPLLEMGYRCIIAHAERYQLSVEDIRELHDIAGIYIQVNADAVLGKEGLFRKLFVWKLLKADLVDFIASDAHNTDTRANHIGACSYKIEKKFGKEKKQEIFCRNPEALFLRTH